MTRLSPGMQEMWKGTLPLVPMVPQPPSKDLLE